MGGGVSLIEGVEELVTTTILIGRAISSMSFPGMFRIYDFHSKRAPKLKNSQQFTFFAPDSDEDEDDSPEPDPEVYSQFFKVMVNGDAIYIENPIEQNESGWTPLHSCCMSMATVSAGLALIDETLRLGGDLEAKTRFGPGTFNKGWTALQMAAGYGIDALVERLVECGADVNTVNGFGYSCLHEACHRGFGDVVRHLLRSRRVDLMYIAPDELAAASPFATAPCQSALAEAARCGFSKIVAMLLEAGAPKDQTNRLGWTALHEACFYHRVETVKTLLLNGCDASLRTQRGALPYHLSGLPEIKDMLRDMGGEGAVPAEDDCIDMIQVLTDLTLSEVRRPAQISDRVTDADADALTHQHPQHSQEMPVIIFSPAQHGQAATVQRTTLAAASSRDDDKEEKEEVRGRSSAFPAVTPTKQSSGMLAADAKETKPSTKKAVQAPVESVPADMPRHFLCELTHKPMSEPMRSVYGNVFDKTAVYQWFAQQGRICPLSGLPLAEIDLSPAEELGAEIRTWLLKRSIGASPQQSPEKKNTSAEDDLYDF